MNAYPEPELLSIVEPEEKKSRINIPWAEIDKWIETVEFGKCEPEPRPRIDPGDRRN